MSRKKIKKPLPVKESLRIKITTTKPNETVKIEVDSMGQLFCRQASSPATLTRRRMRTSGSKKEKITSSYSTGQTRGFTTFLNTIKKKYERVVVIDAGRFKYKGTDLCVVASCYSVDTINPQTENIKFKFFNSYIFQVHEIHEEIIGWHILFNDVLPASNIGEEKICLVTDHQEKYHKQFNTREKPYYENNYLPYNIDIMYSGDRGGHGLNNAVKRCHNICKTIIKQVEGSDIDFPTLKNVTGSAYNIVSDVVLKVQD